MRQPVIGIISARHKRGNILSAYMTNSHYIEQIKICGGLPLQIPLLPDLSMEEMESYISVCDGFLLPGGADFEPEWYGETLLANLQPSSSLDVKTQEAALQFIRAAVVSNKPILGICLGMQVLNVALGGSLIQDIPTQIGNQIPHTITVRTLEDRWKLTHSVSTAKGSMIQQISAAETIQVNSFHHQAVKKLASCFAATAWAPDGVIEAIEHENGKVLGVQWHPENLSHADIPYARALFQWLVNASANII